MIAYSTAIKNRLNRQPASPKDEDYTQGGGSPEGMPMPPFRGKLVTQKLVNRITSDSAPAEKSGPKVSDYTHTIPNSENLEKYKPQFRDSKEAFNEAIKRGHLTEDEESPNYAGKYMYMHSDAKGDYFKDRDTRQYKIVPKMDE